MDFISCIPNVQKETFSVELSYKGQVVVQIKFLKWLVDSINELPNSNYKSSEKAKDFFRTFSEFYDTVDLKVFLLWLLLIHQYEFNYRRAEFDSYILLKLQEASYRPPGCEYIHYPAMGEEVYVILDNIYPALYRVAGMYLGTNWRPYSSQEYLQLKAVITGKQEEEVNDFMLFRDYPDLLES